MDRQIEFVLFIHQFNTGARTNTHTSATNKQKLLQDLEKEGTVPVPADHGLEAGIGWLVKLEAQLGAGHHQLLTHDPTTTTTTN